MPNLEPVIQAGVAPDDFYVSTIYPTEVRINGQWLKVENQRMDGAIAISQTANGIVAKCKILRDLEVGEQVVVDVLGIRTIRKPNHENNAIPKNSALCRRVFPANVAWNWSLNKWLGNYVKFGMLVVK